MSNWVMTLYVITVVNQHGYRDSQYYSDGNPTAYYYVEDCEAALKKTPSEFPKAQCTPFRANMGPIDTVFFCRGCTPEEAEAAIKPHRGRVILVPR